jgi:hypothetical protein
MCLITYSNLFTLKRQVKTGLESMQISTIDAVSKQSSQTLKQVLQWLQADTHFNASYLLRFKLLSHP